MNISPNYKFIRAGGFPWWEIQHVSFCLELTTLATENTNTPKNEITFPFECGQKLPARLPPNWDFWSELFLNMLFFRVCKTFLTADLLQSLLKATGNKIIKKKKRGREGILGLSKSMEIHGINYAKWRNMGIFGDFGGVRSVLMWCCQAAASAWPAHPRQLPQHIKAGGSEESRAKVTGLLQPPRCYQLQALIRTWPLSEAQKWGISVPPAREKIKLSSTF